MNGTASAAQGSNPVGAEEVLLILQNCALAIIFAVMSLVVAFATLVLRIIVARSK